MRVRIALVVGCGLCLALPTGAQGATTIGVPTAQLVTGALANFHCNSPTLVPCTNMESLLSGGIDRADPSFVAPSGGVIVRWRLGSGSSGHPITLRVLRPGSNVSEVTGAGTGIPRTTAIGVTTYENERLPIRAGDTIGVDDADAQLILIGAGDTIHRINRWSPFVADNAAGMDHQQTAPYLLQLNADIEADTDGDGFGDESQDRCPGVPGTVNGCPQADLAVSETASPNPSPVHGQFSYLVQVRNNGPSAVPAGLATVADTVGPSVSLLSANSPGGACTLGAVVRCPVAALAPGGSSTISVTVRADAEGAKANAATVSYVGDTNPANDTVGFTAAVVPGPSISAASVSPKTWRLGSALPRFSRKPPIGTTIRITLSQPARATLTFSQPKTGRKVGRRCVTLTRGNRKKRKCTIPNVRGTLRFNGHAGTNKVRFQGRLSRTKKLTPGRYTLAITATDSAGNRSSPRSTSFTIVRR